MLKTVLTDNLESESSTPALVRTSAAGFRRPKLFLILSILLFLILSLPTLGTFARYRGDESFYTDAAIRMLQTGDYLTPFYATGEARFNKPIFNYWVIVGFFKTLGVNAFASRIGQLIAGVATLPIIYLLARAMNSTKTAAVLAVAIMAANIQLMNTSIRATTDVVQIFFMTLAMLGAARLLFQHSPSSNSRAWIDRTLLAVGVAFGILTKGGMPALFLLFVAAFTLIHRRKLGHKIRQIVNERVILVAAAPFAIWIGMGIYRHGPTAALSFFNDQVASRLDEPVNPLMNFLLYTGSCLLELMPFTALLPLMMWHQSARVKRFFAARRLTVLFTLEWSLLIIAVLIWGDTPRTRYMLLFYPLLAVLLGQLIAYLAHRDETQKPMLRIIQLMLIGIGLMGIAEIVFGIRVSPNIIVGGLLVATTAALALWFSRHKNFAWQLAALALVLMASYRYQDIFIRGVLNPSPVPQITSALEKLHRPTLRMATIEDAYFAPQIRLASGGSVHVDIAYASTRQISFDDGDNDPANDPQYSASLAKLTDTSYDVYLIPSTIQIPPELGDFNSLGTVANFRNWRWGDYLAVTVGAKTAQQIFDKRRQEYVLLARRK